MNESVSVILASARSDGDTRCLLDAVIGARQATIFDLASLTVLPYDYAESVGRDAFIQIIETIMGTSTVLFATPVYWYSMSAQLKAFFDRLTDLLHVQKELGRALHGKRIAFVASGTDAELPLGFEVPFQRTSDYLGMRYTGAHYACFASARTLSAEQIAAAAAFGRALWGHAR